MAVSSALHHVGDAVRVDFEGRSDSARSRRRRGRRACAAASARERFVPDGQRIDRAVWRSWHSGWC